MFELSNTPDWLKRATDIANSMDLGEDMSVEYEDTKSRMKSRQQDIDSRWSQDPSWEKMSDDMKTGMTLAVDAAGGTGNTGGLFAQAQDWNNESNMSQRAEKQKQLAESAAKLVGKKPKSDQQSVNFAGLTFNIANNRYSGHESGKAWARNNASHFTDDKNSHVAQNSSQNRSYNQKARDEGAMNPEPESYKTIELPGGVDDIESPSQTQINEVEAPPVINKEQDRLRSILDNKPAKFEIQENPEHTGAEVIWENPYQGYLAVTEHEKVIKKMALKHGVDEDLVRAVMWAENARGHKYGLNFLADMLGISDSGLPMNMNHETGAKLLNKPRSGMANAENNIEAAVIFLKRIGDRIDKPTASKIGSIWNFNGREKVNNFGASIQRIYDVKPWRNPKDEWISTGGNDGP